MHSLLSSLRYEYSFIQKKERLHIFPNTLIDMENFKKERLLFKDVQYNLF